MGDAPVDPPLQVDWIGPADLGDGLPGRLGMTALPGKHGPSIRYPGRVYQRELTADLVTLRAHGVRFLALLVDDDELARWGDPLIVARGAEKGIEIVRRPIPDGAAPRDVDAMREILASLDRARASADVAVACMGGVGRTGTVAACALVARGWGADEAIGRIRELRHPTAVETRDQVLFVHDFARSFG